MKQQHTVHRHLQQWVTRGRLPRTFARVLMLSTSDRLVHSPISPDPLWTQPCLQRSDGCAAVLCNVANVAQKHCLDHQKQPQRCLGRIRALHESCASVSVCAAFRAWINHALGRLPSPTHQVTCRFLKTPYHMFCNGSSLRAAAKSTCKVRPPGTCHTGCTEWGRGDSAVCGLGL